MIKLSIIIPVFNCEKYIENCIKTIINNNYYDYEIIVVNDGSKDNTKKIVEDIKDKRIKLFNNENHGVSYSRNFGLSKAIGEYIMFVDADDLLNNNWYDLVIRNLDKDITIFSIKNISSLKNVLIKQICGLNGDGVIIAAPFSKVYKKEIIVKNKIKFNEKIINGEDMLFNLHFIKYCESINVVNKSFYKYRINYGSATKSFNEKIFLSDIQFQKELSSLIEDENIINTLGNNGLFTIVDRISYVKKYKEAKKLFKKIDLFFYKRFDDKSLNNFEKKIVRRTKKERYFLNFCILSAKHLIISKIKKEYLKEI